MYLCESFNSKILKDIKERINEMINLVQLDFGLFILTKIKRLHKKLEMIAENKLRESFTTYSRSKLH